jgi:molybdate transport system substrate-binding protein
MNPITRIRSLRASVFVIAALVLLAALATTASARQQRRSDTQLTIYAASSLTTAFPLFDGAQKYNFAGSDALATQIKLGAPADIFASASPDQPQALYAAGIVGKPVTFATNKLVLIVPASNPAGINSVYDLTRKGIKLDIGTPTVPIGSYTRQILGNLGLSETVLPQVVTQDKDVATIAAHVGLGTLDAGFVYITDALTAGSKVQIIKLPAWAQPPVRYQIAAVTKSANQAADVAWIKRLTSTAGRKLLVANGFGVPKLPVVKKPKKTKKK